MELNVDYLLPLYLNYTEAHSITGLIKLTYEVATYNTTTVLWGKMFSPISEISDAV